MCSCIQVIRDGEVKRARKIHYCMAFENIRESVLTYRRDYNLKFSEWRAIIKMRDNHGIIDKGQPYYWQFNTNYDGAYVFKADKKMHEICVKYDLYPCEC